MINPRVGTEAGSTTTAQAPSKRELARTQHPASIGWFPRPTMILPTGLQPALWGESQKGTASPDDVLSFVMAVGTHQEGAVTISPGLGENKSSPRGQAVIGRNTETRGRVPGKEPADGLSFSAGSAMGMQPGQPQPRDTPVPIDGALQVCHPQDALGCTASHHRRLGQGGLPPCGAEERSVDAISQSRPSPATSRRLPPTESQ